jgi:hypothetical protein
MKSKQQKREEALIRLEDSEFTASKVYRNRHPKDYSGGDELELHRQWSICKLEALITLENAIERSRR